MSNRNKGKYFDVKTLSEVEKGCNWLFLLGERSCGKSYSVKHHTIKQAYDSIEGNICHKELAYIRRFDLDCKDSVCEPYFADVPVTAITNGRYSHISIYRKRIYFANLTDEGKPLRGVCIGQCFALSSAEHYKSLMFPRIQNCIYEEVVSQNNQYLYREPFALQQLISTILRDRVGMVYLIGNTISRLCPYYGEFGLKNVESIDEGMCNIYHLDKTVLKVYRCKSRKYNSGMFFGKPAKNITEGEYYTEEKPILPKKLREYRCIYTCVIEYSPLTFLARFLSDDSTRDKFWYIEPKTTPIRDNTRVISNRYNPSLIWTHGFLPLTENEDKAFKYLTHYNKVCYSDNLTGTEFDDILTDLL